MSKLLHRLGHAAIVAITLMSLYAGYVPGRYAPIALAAQGLAHAILAEVSRKG